MKLTTLKNIGKATFTVAMAGRKGVSPQLLSYYAHTGAIERVSHGLYRFAQGDEIQDFHALLLEKLKIIPQGVIGLRTALRLHGLTDELPGEIDIIVPDTNIPKRKLIDVSLHPKKTSLYKLDVEKVRGIVVTSLERTLVDLMREGESLAFMLEIYREAKARKKVMSLSKLKKLSLKFQAKQRMAIFLEAVL